MIRRRKPLRSKTADTLFHTLSFCYKHQLSDRGGTDIGPTAKDDVPLICTDILPNDSPCPKDASMDETRVVLDTQEDGLSDTQLKLAQPDHNIVGESTVLSHNVDTDRSMDETRVVLDTQEDGLVNTQLKLAQPDHNIVGESTVLSHNVDTDRSMDETRVVLDTQEDGLLNTQLKLAQPDHNIVGESTVLYHNTDPSVSFDLNDNLMDSVVSSSPRLPTDKDVKEGEISGDFMDITPEDSTGIVSRVESDNNLSLLSTVAVENVGKDMTGTVNKNTRNLVDCFEIVVPEDSREPAKQATAVIGSDLSLRRSGRVLSLKSSKTRNQDLVNPKRQGSSTQEERVYIKPKKLLDLTTCPENINSAGEHHEDASCKVVDASVNKNMDNPKEKEAPSVRKLDNAWEHVTHIEENGKKVLVCNFCRKIIRGGGINRVKKHLAGQKGEVTPCTLVDPDVRFAIQGTFKGTDHKSKEEVSEDDDDEELDDVNLLNNKDKGGTDIGPITKDDVPLVCTDILPNDSPCPKDASMDETRVVLDTQEDGSSNTRLKFAEPDHNIVGESTVLCHNVDTDGSMDETRVVLDTQENGSSNTQLKLAEPDHNVIVETTEFCHNTDPWVSFDLNDQENLMDSKASSPRLPTDKDVKEGEISGDFMDFTPEDSIGIESRVENDNNLSPLSTVADENVGKDMTGIVDKDTRSLVDCSEIVVPENSREPAKQATAVIGSHLSLRRSGRVNPLKRQGSSTQEERVYKRAKKLVDLTTCPENIISVGENHENASRKVVNASVNKNMDNPKDKEAPSVRKLDNAWEHVTQHVDENGKKVLICNFCRKNIRGGGINRVKKHLAGRMGEVAPCTLVDPDVRFAIQGTLKGTHLKSKEKVSNVISDDVDIEEQDDVNLLNNKDKGDSLVCTDILPNDSPCPKDASMDETRVVLDTHEDDLLDEQLKLAEPDETRVVLDKGDTDITKDGSMDETQVVLDTQEDGLLESTIAVENVGNDMTGIANKNTRNLLDYSEIAVHGNSRKPAKQATAVIGSHLSLRRSGRVLSLKSNLKSGKTRNQDLVNPLKDAANEKKKKRADVNLLNSKDKGDSLVCTDILPNDSPCPKDASMDETRVVLDTHEDDLLDEQLKLAEPDETRVVLDKGDTDITKDASMDETRVVLDTQQDGLLDSTGIESTIVAENVGKDMVGIVNKNTRNLVDCSEIVVHGNSGEPAKQATAVIDSDSSLRRSGRLLSLDSNLRNSKTRNQNLINPPKERPRNLVDYSEIVVHGNSREPAKQATAVIGSDSSLRRSGRVLSSESNLRNSKKRNLDRINPLKDAANEKKKKRVVTRESKGKQQSMNNPKDKEAPSVRKLDNAWEHVTHVEENGKKVLSCNFCRKIIRGGGINRVKKHLAGRMGEVAPCTLVDPAVRFAIEGTLKETDHKSKEKGLAENELRTIITEEVARAIQAAMPAITGSANRVIDFKCSVKFL